MFIIYICICVYTHTHTHIYKAWIILIAQIHQAITGIQQHFSLMLKMFSQNKSYFEAVY